MHLFDSGQDERQTTAMKLLNKDCVKQASVGCVRDELECASSSEVMGPSCSLLSLHNALQE